MLDIRKLETMKGDTDYLHLKNLSEGARVVFVREHTVIMNHDYSMLKAFMYMSYKGSVYVAIDQSRSPEGVEEFIAAVIAGSNA